MDESVNLFFRKNEFDSIVSETNHVITITVGHLHKDVACKLAPDWSLVSFQIIGLAWLLAG